AVGSTIRLIIRRSVVLPDPLEPTRTVVVRDGMVRLKSSTASVPSGNLFDTESNVIMVTPSSDDVRGNCAWFQRRQCGGEDASIVTPGSAGVGRCANCHRRTGTWSTCAVPQCLSHASRWRGTRPYRHGHRAG